MLALLPPISCLGTMAYSEFPRNASIYLSIITSQIRLHSGCLFLWLQQYFLRGRRNHTNGLKNSSTCIFCVLVLELPPFLLLRFASLSEGCSSAVQNKVLWILCSYLTAEQSKMKCSYAPTGIQFRFAPYSSKEKRIALLYPITSQNKIFII